MTAIDDKQIHQIVQRVLAQVMGQAQIVQRPLSVAGPGPGHSPARIQSGRRKVVAIGADHGGFELKEILQAYLTELGFDVRDVGAYNKGAVDYPDFAHEVARLVSTGKAWRGIMIDGAGIGSCIVANKVPGVRAGMAYDLFLGGQQPRA